MDKVEKAEVTQNLKAYLIPSGMFLATVVNAAGIFLIYNEYPVGWILVAIGVTSVVVALVAFARLQNNYRVKGQMKDPLDRRVSPPPVVQGQPSPADDEIAPLAIESPVSHLDEQVFVR